MVRGADVNDTDIGAARFTGGGIVQECPGDQVNNALGFSGTVLADEFYDVTRLQSVGENGFFNVENRIGTAAVR